LFGRESRELHDVHGGRGVGILFGGIDGVGEIRPLGVEAEIVEIDVTPVAALLVNDADKNVAALMGGKIDHRRAKSFGFIANDFENDLLCFGVNEFDAGVFVIAAGDAEAGPGMGDLERNGSESAMRIVAEPFVSADPKLPFMKAAHIAATWRDGVAADGLPLERFSLSGPVLEGAVLEPEVERAAIGVFRDEARLGGKTGDCGSAEKRDWNDAVHIGNNDWMPSVVENSSLGEEKQSNP
jgi:hypothetical protein